MRERKSGFLMVRLRPSVKRHLEAMARKTGYSMSVLVEALIMKMTPEQFPNAPTIVGVSRYLDDESWKSDDGLLINLLRKEEK